MITKTFHIISHTLNYWFKGLLLTLLTAMPLGVVAAVGDTFISDGIIYEIVIVNSEVWVKGLEASYEKDILEIPDDVTNNGLTYKVTGLSTNCFKDKTISALSFENIGYYPFNIPASFSNCTIKYLDLTSSLLSFASTFTLSGCSIERLVISKNKYNIDVLNSATKITTLVCPDLDFVPTELTSVTTVIVPNAYASQSTDPIIKGFGDVSDKPVGTFFSFVAGENLLFEAGGDIEAYIPMESPWQGESFNLVHKNKTENFIATKGMALFLKIKDGSVNKKIPSAATSGSATSSLFGSISAAFKTKPESENVYYYSLKKGEEGLFQYKGTFIPPGVAVVESNQVPPSTQTSPSGASVRAIKMVVGEQATAIETLQEEKVENIETCYDLFGNPANNQSTEIRIINGKKVVRR